MIYYAMRSDGSWRAVDGPGNLEAGEMLVDQQPPALPLIDPVAPALTAIRALEASVTPRRLREAVLGIDNGWLRDLDAQIAALRTQLQNHAQT